MQGISTMTTFSYELLNAKRNGESDANIDKWLMECLVKSF